MNPGGLIQKCRYPSGRSELQWRPRPDRLILQMKKTSFIFAKVTPHDSIFNSHCHVGPQTSIAGVRRQRSGWKEGGFSKPCSPRVLLKKMPCVHIREVRRGGLGILRAGLQSPQGDPWHHPWATDVFCSVRQVKKIF